MNKVISLLLLNIFLFTFVIANPLESENNLLKTTSISSGTNTSSTNFIINSGIGDITSNTSSANKVESGFFPYALGAQNNISKPLLISLWIKRESIIIKETPIVCKWNRTLGINLRSYCLTIDTNNKTRYYISNDGITFARLTSTEALPLNRWTQISALYNNTHIALYLNGVLDVSASYTLGYFDITLPFIIGAGDINGTERRFYNGTLDELSLWYIALSTKEIQALYEKEKTRFEFIISNSTDFSAENILFSRLTINNYSESSYSDDDYIILLEHFNSYSKISANNGTTNAKLSSGKFGNGIEIIDNTNLTYQKPNRFRDIEGSIEIWVKPKSNYNDNTIRFFFDDNNAKFRLYKDANNNLIWEINSNKISYDISTWNTNTNHHIAVTWKQNKNFSIITDGILRNQTAISSIGTSGNLFYIGTNSSNSAQANAIIDEIRISNIARLPENQLINSSYTLKEIEALSEDTYYWKARTTDIDRRIDKITGLTFSEWSQYRKFSIEVTSPTISLINPANNSYSPTTEVTFNYTPKDTNLHACELWINYTTWQMNQTTLNPVSGIINQFKLNLTDSVYIWNIRCNDTLGNRSFSEKNFTFTVDIIEPSVALISPNNNTVDADGVITFSYNVTDSNPILNCTLIINNNRNLTNTTITKDATINFSTTIGSGKYNWSINCTDNALNTNNTETRILTAIKSTKFTGKSTDLTAFSDLSNISTLTLETPLYGILSFLDNVDLRNGYDLDKYINISSDRIELNTTALPVLNKSANITFYNISFTDPLILRDGSSCSSTICNELRYIGGNFTFNVSHFTVYSVVETPLEQVPSESVTGGGSGGGGGGATKGAVVPKTEILPENIIRNIEVDTKEIVADTRVNKDIVRTFRVKNTGNIDESISITTSGIPLFVSSQEFTLQPREEKQITISFVSDKEGLYIGRLYISAGDIKKEIALSLGVESISALFDISLDIPKEYSNIHSGEYLNAQITLINILGTLVDVTITYIIKTIDGEFILEESETFAVDNQKSFVKRFILPMDIKPGKYVISAEIRYANSYALSSKLFSVIPPIKEAFSPPDFFWWIRDKIYIVSILIVIAIIGFGLLKIKKIANKWKK